MTATSLTARVGQPWTVGVVVVALIGPPFRLLLAVAIGAATGIGTVARRGGRWPVIGEEHLVQCRLAQGHVLGGDVGGVQLAQRLGQRPGAIGCREHDPAVVLVVGQVLAADAPQRLEGPDLSDSGTVTSSTEPPTRSFSWSPVPSPISRPWSMTAIRSAS